MPPLLTRLSLLLLLALDWAVGPELLAPALHALARPWCSTENVCPSSAYREAVRRESTPEPRVASARIPRGPTPQRLAAATRPPPPTPPPRDLVYLYMSLRR